MSFDTYETGNEDGRPIALYRFQWGNSIWRFTSADRDILQMESIDGVDTEVTYEVAAITDKNFVQGGASTPEFTITVPTALPVVDLFRATPPSQPVILTVRTMHMGDDDARIFWIGRIANVKRNDPAEAEIVCRNSGLRRNGLRLTWSRACNHFLYGPGCLVDKSLHAHVRVITAITGTTVSVAAVSGNPAMGHFDGGFLEWDADGLGTIERRGIEMSLADDVHQIFGRTDGLVVGQTVTLYPGCDRSAQTCHDKFDNLPNHGGVSFMPEKSPFDGTQIF